MKNISTLFGWVKGMLEGSDIEPPMSMQEVVNRLNIVRYDGAG